MSTAIITNTSNCQTSFTTSKAAVWILQVTAQLTCLYAGAAVSVGLGPQVAQIKILEAATFLFNIVVGTGMVWTLRKLGRQKAAGFAFAILVGILNFLGGMLLA